MLGQNNWDSDALWIPLSLSLFFFSPSIFHADGDVTDGNLKFFSQLWEFGGDAKGMWWEKYKYI